MSQYRNSTQGAASYRLSKSRFTTGLQCHRLLWWKVHERDAPELTPDPLQQATFDRGNHVGEVARTYVPGGVLIDFVPNRLAASIAQTQAEITRGVPAIYEACWSEDRVFVAVDILQRHGPGWTLVEVKSSTKAKPEHVPDAAIQTHVLRRAGIDVRSAHIMHLNRECTFPDLSNLFARTDVTAEVEEFLPSIPTQIGHQLDMLAGPLPDVAPGPHCTRPYECPFLNRCCPKREEHHISTLYRKGHRARELEAAGIETIAQIPDEQELSLIQQRQRLAITRGELIVEPGLGAALATFLRPLAFLDFETIAPPIPVWTGCRPYDQVPVQFSAHVESAGSYDHHEFLADGPEDPRAALAQRLLEACRGANTVLAYNASFERRCIDGLAEAAPGLASELMQIRSKIQDLLPLIRNHVYHPDFNGSFSMKAVLPALCPELGYENLEVSSGALASVELEGLLLEGIPGEEGEREAMRRALLAYCERDTWGMVGVVDVLRELSPPRCSDHATRRY